MFVFNLDSCRCRLGLLLVISFLSSALLSADEIVVDYNTGGHKVRAYSGDTLIVTEDGYINVQSGTAVSGSKESNIIIDGTVISRGGNDPIIWLFEGCTAEINGTVINYSPDVGYGVRIQNDCTVIFNGYYEVHGYLNRGFYLCKGETDENTVGLTDGTATNSLFIGEDGEIIAYDDSAMPIAIAADCSATINGTVTTYGDRSQALSLGQNNEVTVGETANLNIYGESIHASCIRVGYRNILNMNGTINLYGNGSDGIHANANNIINVTGDIIACDAHSLGIRATDNNTVNAGGFIQDCYTGICIDGDDNSLNISGGISSNSEDSTNSYNIYGVHVYGDDNWIELLNGATISLSGKGSYGIFIIGWNDYNNTVVVGGKIITSGTDSTAILSDSNNIVIVSGEIEATGDGAIAIDLYNNDSTLYLSGSVSGPTAIRSGAYAGENAVSTLDENSIFILSGASINGDIINGDTESDGTSLLAFGYSKNSDGTANLSAVDNSFYIEISNDIITTSDGGWDGFIAGGTVDLKGNVNQFCDLYIGAETFDGRTMPSVDNDVLSAINGAGATLNVGFGTVSVSGDMVMGAHSVLGISVDGDGNCSVITVDGTAHLDGTLKLLACDELEVGDTFQFLTAGSIDGTFAGKTSSTALYDFDLSYTDSQVSLEINDIRSFSNFSGGLSGNQQALGRVLSGCMGAASGADLAVLQELAGLSSGELEDEMRRMTPESVLGGVSAGIGAATSYGGGQVSRMQSLLAYSSPYSTSGGVGPEGPAGPESEELAALATGEWQVWAQSFGSWVDQDERKGAAGYESDTAGMIAGLDRNFGDFILGGALGGSVTDVESDGNSATTSQDSVHLGLYAATRRGPFEFTGDVSLALADQDTKRKTALSQTAKGETDSVAGSARVGISYEKRLEKWLLKPGASVRYTRYKQDSYTETGAGSLNLEVGEIDTESCVSSLGVEVSRPVGERGSVKLSAAWEHEFRDTATSVTSRLSLAGSDTFDTKGLESDPDRFVLGVGGTYRLRENVEIFADGSVTLADELTRYDAAMGIRISF